MKIIDSKSARFTISDEELSWRSEGRGVEGVDENINKRGNNILSIIDISFPNVRESIFPLNVRAPRD
jgi:hypothetical protein